MVGPLGGGRATRDEYVLVAERGKQCLKPPRLRSGVVVEEHHHTRRHETDRRVPGPGQPLAAGVGHDVHERAGELTGGPGEKLVVVVDDDKNPAVAPGLPELQVAARTPSLRSAQRSRV